MFTLRYRLFVIFLCRLSGLPPLKNWIPLSKDEGMVQDKQKSYQMILLIPVDVTKCLSTDQMQLAIFYQLLAKLCLTKVNFQPDCRLCYAVVMWEKCSYADFLRGPRLEVS